jgi:hypothetical protein
MDEWHRLQDNVWLLGRMKGRKMKANPVQAIAGAFIALFFAASVVPAQVPQPPATGQTAPQFTPEQLDQMLAPIALYPDPLLAPILMAATYPLEVVQADRWVQDPQNAALAGTALTAALQQQPWEPSVKSLVPFPQILRMMDSNLTWTESLGEAFLANQPAVMDAVQRLRQRAQAAGQLRATPQEAVTTEGQAIVIEPANPEIVYIPVYDPTIAYAPWPYAAYPPYYFPGFFDSVIIGGFGWFGVSVVRPLWGWDHWDWAHRRIDVDRDRFALLNRNHPPVGGGAWEHDPSHRRAVPYGTPETRSRFAVNAPPPEAIRGVRGYPAAPAGQAAPPPAERPPPAVESYGRGAEVRQQSERGHSSRTSAPSVSSQGGRGRR